MDSKDLPEQTRENIVKIATLFRFKNKVVTPNTNSETGFLFDNVDWNGEIEKFNQSSGGPEISIDDVVGSFKSTRMPPESVEQANRIASQLGKWLQKNQEEQ